ncbi:MAG: hypothetical protein ACREF9_15605, partial [Opitutaceae bacterium]
TPAVLARALENARPRAVPDAASDDPRAAHLVIDGAMRVVAPNVRGEFTRVVIAPAAVIAASVPFPDAQPGEQLAIQAEDGGVFVTGGAEARVEITPDRQAHFQFQTSANDGLHRVTLRRGGESRVLQFWVGPEVPVIIRSDEASVAAK